MSVEDWSVDRDRSTEQANYWEITQLPQLDDCEDLSDRSPHLCPLPPSQTNLTHWPPQGYPPIRRVSTNQSLSRDSTQSFNRVDVELTVFSRDSALGVRQGGSAGVGGRGTSGYLGHLLLLSEAAGDHKIYTFFCYFAILHLFTFLSQNNPRKRSQKCQKS